MSLSLQHQYHAALHPGLVKPTAYNNNLYTNIIFTGYIYIDDESCTGDPIGVNITNVEYIERTLSGGSEQLPVAHLIWRAWK